MNTRTTRHATPAPANETASTGAVPLNTNILFPAGSNERKIVHDNTEYRLRITAQGKLILTK